MELGYTWKLGRYLKNNNLDYGIEKELFFCWDLHRILLHNIETLVIINSNNRFTCVVSNMKPSLWNNIEDCFFMAIKEGLLLEGYNNIQVDKYISLSKELSFTRTHGKRAVAFLNKAIDDMYNMPLKIDNKNLLQKDYMLEINNRKCKSAGFNYVTSASNFLYEDMKRISII